MNVWAYTFFVIKQCYSQNSQGNRRQQILVSRRVTACMVLSKCGQHKIILTNILVSKACGVISGFIGNAAHLSQW